MIAEPGVPRKSGTARRLLSNPLAFAAILVLVVIIASAALAAPLSPQAPNHGALDDVFAPVSVGHPMGADGAGRDILSRMLWGGQVSLLGAALALVVAMLIGVPTGLLAGYYRKGFDAVFGWFSSLVMALPAIIVLLAVRAVAGPSIWISMTIFGVILSPAFFRLTRSAVLNVRDELYVDAARVSGLRDARIIGRHVLTVVRAPIIIQAALVAGIALAVQSGLEFLGIGDQSTPTWGGLLNDGFSNIYSYPLMIAWPALAIGLTCASLAILGSALRDALEDRGRVISAARSRRKAGLSVRPRIEREVGTDLDEAPSKASGADSAHLLDVNGLEVSYIRPGESDLVVVHDVSLHIRRGEVLGLVGESGSGKSQTAFSVLGLLPTGGRVSAGAITFEGKRLDLLSRSQMTKLPGSSIAYIPQEPMSNLDPSFRVGQQLTDPMRIVLGLSEKEARKRAIELLERVGIRDPHRTFAAYPHEISGGMAQRVLIAGAVSCQPKLLIADEPTTALDVTVQAEVLELLRSLKDEFRLGVLLVTHDLGVVADICDRVAVMQSGRIVETDEVRSIFRHPQHPYTRMLLNSTPEGGDRRPDLVDADMNGGVS
ncbi:dipeptide/oligopeptide/nickel ABC transporter permease/ATP-binding protein [Microbacterium sp. PMB16]|uniref:dipeptide/oligopeptide/nickel ABC transporter permease/ATP-binding protein n=1 Tax=Microbacterium sp. PMB16 TaxID=3120157 RepID=UPI003F4C970C